MTAPEREALEALNRRVDQMAATARIFACDNSNNADMTDRLYGLADTLNELAAKFDAFFNPTRAEGRI